MIRCHCGACVALIFLLVPIYGYLAFAALLSGYYLFTVGIAAARVLLDLNSHADSALLSDTSPSKNGGENL